MPPGKRAATGSFFTPEAMVDGALAGLDSAPQSFLDPCCGTGRFLLAAGRRFSLPLDKLYGFDLDPVALDIAAINLLLAYSDSDALPCLHRCDSLRLASLPKSMPSGGVDAIVSNPPWGARNSADADAPNRNSNQTRIRSGETFSLFIEKSLEWLAPGGRLSFLLPDSVLSTKSHADVRQMLLRRVRIVAIAYLRQRFPGVYTPVVRLDLEKSQPKTSTRVRIITPDGVAKIRQNQFGDNPGHTFNLDIDATDRELLDKLRDAAKHSLKGNAQWALGVVTGDNKRWLSDSRSNGMEPILRGRDIHPYRAAQPGTFITYRPEQFQQVAQSHLYRAPEKLIYRFVSSRLVVCYDNQQLLTLNSANILIPAISGISITIALALLTSPYLVYCHNKLYPGRKVLRRDLESLPLPGLSSRDRTKVETLVAKRLAGDPSPEQQLSDIIGKAFNLTEPERRIITSRAATKAGRHVY